jgi:adenylate kinase family enzyme
VRVVGVSGAGKSTLGAALAERLGVPHLQLDEVFHGPGWVGRTDDEGSALVDAFLTGPGRTGWVVDGNWNSRVGAWFDTADVIVWVDPPRRVSTARVLRRTLWRSLTRAELWNGNREHPSNLLRLDPERNVVLWSWRTYDEYQRRYGALAGAGTIPVVRLRTARAVRAWLAAQAAPGPERSSLP